jgi:hypothetical protein
MNPLPCHLLALPLTALTSILLLLLNQVPPNAWNKEDLARIPDPPPEPKKKVVDKIKENERGAEAEHSAERMELRFTLALRCCFLYFGVPPNPWDQEDLARKPSSTA